MEGGLHGFQPQRQWRIAIGGPTGALALAAHAATLPPAHRHKLVGSRYVDPSTAAGTKAIEHPVSVRLNAEARPAAPPCAAHKSFALTRQPAAPCRLYLAVGVGSVVCTFLGMDGEVATGQRKYKCREQSSPRLCRKPLHPADPQLAVHGNGSRPPHDGTACEKSRRWRIRDRRRFRHNGTELTMTTSCVKSDPLVSVRLGGCRETGAAAAAFPRADICRGGALREHDVKICRLP